MTSIGGNLTLRQRKKAIEEARNWIRTNNPSPDDVDEPTLTALTNLAGIKMPRVEVKPKDKREATEQALNWLRNNDPSDTVDLYDLTIIAFSNLAGTPSPTGKLSHKQKRRAIDETLQWLRNNEPSLDSVGATTVEAFRNLPGIPVQKLSPSEKQHPCRFT